MKTLILHSCLAIIFISKITSCGLASGSYPYAEQYELDYPEEKVKMAITKFKQQHPEYVVPKVTIENQKSWNLSDGQSKEPPHWYGVYFYYKNENKILYTWTRPLENNKTTFAFVSINDGLNLGNWKDINKDFDRSENKIQKQMFEERILNKIKEYLNNDAL